MVGMPHPELIEGLRAVEPGAAGYYPSGWPALLGLFDGLNVGWLANPVIGAGVVVVTYALVRDIVGGRVAVATAVVLAASPWVYMNAVDQLTHMASTLWLMLFLLGFQRTLGDRSLMWAAGSGLALSAAIMTRPQDAVIFALPCIALAVWRVVTAPRTSLVPLGMVAVMTLPGVALYLLSNLYYSGSMLSTSYGEDAHGLHQAPESMFALALWLHESVSELNIRWFAGVFPAAFFVLIGLWFGWRRLRPARLFLACSASLCVLYSLFIFNSRSFMGPRWYAPLAPAIAFLIAVGVVEALDRARTAADRLERQVASSYLALVAVVFLAAWAVGMPARLWDLAVRPPHGVSTAVVDAARAQGLTQAVVGLPPDYFFPGTSEPNYRIPRNGTWAMDMPLERNAVIFVVAAPGWEAKARDLWPERALYEVFMTPGEVAYSPLGRPALEE
jgi:4-amino-4-deoxy-L-arabinose transferase-like glycosyltransferase